MSSGGPNIHCCDGNKSPKHTYIHHGNSLLNGVKKKKEEVVNYQTTLEYTKKIKTFTNPCIPDSKQKNKYHEKKLLKCDSEKMSFQ